MDPQERELDMIFLTVLVFLPAAVAGLLLLVPRGYKELMRWMAVFACAGTLALSLCVWVDYYHRVLEFRSDRGINNLYHPASRLDARVENQQALSGRPIPGPFLSYDLVTIRPWISQFDVNYALGVDGISLLMVILTALVTLLAVVAAWTTEDKLRGYLVLILCLESGVIGAFLSLDLFLFYVCFEMLLLPMYFLIGVWGGGRRKYAALKFVLYTLGGSLGLLAGLIALYTTNARDFVDQSRVEQIIRERAARSQGPGNIDLHTFDIVTLCKIGRAAQLVLTDQADRIGVMTVDGKPPENGRLPLFAPGVNRDQALARFRALPVCTATFQYLVFGLLFLGFAVKIPLVPLHSWLPDAHVEAPTPISMILAGVLLKLGGYGLIRIAFPICPWAAQQLAWWIALIGVVSIVYGAVVALGQTDFKKLLAYSSVSHMGFVVLGLASWSADQPQYWEWGVNGAVFQMLAHGVTSAGLFFVVGVVYDRAHHRELNLLGGLTESMPVYTGLSAILFFASMGLPGLCGFVGEFNVLMAAWAFSPALAVPAILSTVLTGAYLLWAWQRVFWGINPETASYPDVTVREFVVLFPLVLLAIVLGVIPSVLVTSWVDPSVTAFMALMTP